MKVGLIGCGAIGDEIAHAIDKQIPQMQLGMIYDIQREKANRVANTLTLQPKMASGIQQVVEETDFIVEAASAEIVGELLELVLQKEKHVLIMSIGGVLEHLDIIERIKKGGGCNIYFPSGAIAGLDGLNAAREKEIESVILTTTKHPTALAGASCHLEEKINLEEIKKPTLIFEGTAREAVRAFPKNINVSAALSLAGIGMEKTRVRIVADPGMEKNQHKIQIKGACGQMQIIVNNVPSPANPKTSYLAALSAVATLKKIISPIKIGT